MVVDTIKLINIDYEICNPANCNYECLNVCHVNKRNQDNPAIFNTDGKPVIDAKYCTLCSRCERSCPLGAITITNKSKKISESSKTLKPIESSGQSDQVVDLKVWTKSPYVMDSDVFNPFNEENTIFARVGNDPSFESYQTGIYVNHEDIFKLNKKGYSRIDAALSSAAWTVHDKFKGAFDWGKLKPDPEIKFDADLVEPSMNRFNVENTEELTEFIKQTAKGYGAAFVGISELNRDWLYTHDRSGKPIEIPQSVTKVIVLAVEMDLEALQTSPAYPASFATGNGYSKLAFVQSCLAEFIRVLGFSAIPAANGVGLSVPHAIDAGLGQYGRHGLLITPKLGSNVRICKVYTDLPLIPDKPIDFGVLEFCRTCMRCAENCPSQSISYDKDPTWSGSSISNNKGILKWYVNVDSCYTFWTVNGNDCSTCITSCPFTKSRHWSHGITRYFIKKFPFLNRIWVKLDHWMGYGKQRDPEEFWDGRRKFNHER